MAGSHACACTASRRWTGRARAAPSFSTSQRWKTARTSLRRTTSTSASLPRREPGNDWAIIALAQPGIIKKIEVDTAHFKGNYPDRCSFQAARVTGGTDSSLVTQAMFWPVLLGEQKLQLDKQHYYESELAALGPVTHVRFNIIPDGGVSRVRLWGTLA